MRNQGQPILFWQIQFKIQQIFFKTLTNTWQQRQSRVQQEANQNEKSGAVLIDSPRKFAWKLGSCRNYRPAINQRIMSQTRTRVVQTCQSFLDSFAGIFQSFARMGKTIFHAVLYNNRAGNTTNQPARYNFFTPPTLCDPHFTHTIQGSHSLLSSKLQNTTGIREMLH